MDCCEESVKLVSTNSATISKGLLVADYIAVHWTDLGLMANCTAADGNYFSLRK